MTRRAARLVALVAAVVGVGCFELSGPAGGVASISAIVAASPAVADGDVMRDSTGAPAPLRVDAFDSDGNLVDAEVSFVVLDTGASVDATGLVRGDTARATPVRIVARVGALQTQPVLVRVVAPIARVRDTATALDTTLVSYPPPAALVDTALGAFGFVLRDAEDAGVPGWPVRFAILRSTVVARDVNVPAVRLVGDDGRTPSPLDTTDTQGVGVRRLLLAPLAMDPARVAQRPTDTVEVRVTTVVGDTVHARTYRFIIQPRAQP